MNTDSQTMAYYASHSGMLADRYQAGDGGVSDYFGEAFKGFSRILDVGCGSGRDLARLLQLGHDAVGADACQDMLDTAADTLRAAGYAPDERLVLDGLPELSMFGDADFDGVLCSTVLMHLPDEHLFDAVYGMRRVLRPAGRLLLSIPASRPDIDPKTRRDPHGRYFADLPPAKLRLLLERVGFRLLWEKTSADALGRADTAWITFLFERSCEESKRPLDQVESILNRDKKDATYKLALFRALADIAQTQYNIASHDQPGRVGIPIHALAECWLVYYWPIVASETFIPQKYGELPGSAKPVAIRAPVRAVIDAFGEGGGLPAFMVALKSGRLPPPVQKAYQNAIRHIQRTIWTMPVRYAGGGAGFSVFGYDRAGRRVTMPETLWRELTLTGSWIMDATILRWAELTERLSKGSASLSLVVEKLLSISDPDRETRDARLLYERINVTECVWSAKPIRDTRFDVDHVIPFVLWRNNDLWNLLPAHPSVNNAKRDFLPAQSLLRRRRDAVIGYWEALRDAFTERFDREASGLCGGVSLQRGNWQTALFGRLTEAVEITAIQRCVPRWEPAAQSARATTVSVSDRRMQGTGYSPSMPRVREEASNLSATRPAPIASPGPMVSEPQTFDFADIADQVFRRYLPFVGVLAAGAPFSGFDISDLDQEAQTLPWLAVPERLCGKNRFVLRIAGDSMEPELSIGDCAVFEYHRTPHQLGQIVIANIAELGTVSDLNTVHAVKRLLQDADQWIFKSTNAHYDDIRVPKQACAYPILGIMVGRL